MSKRIVKSKYFHFILLLDIVTCIIRFALAKTYSNNIVIESMCVVILIFLSIFAFIDKEQNIVSDKLLIIAVAIWIIMIGGYIAMAREEGLALLLFSLGGSFLGGIIFLICYLITKGQVGGGDVKLSFVMGLFLTIERILPVIIYGTLFCSICSIILLIMKKTTLKSTVPLVPFLHIGLCITLMMM